MAFGKKKNKLRRLILLIISCILLITALSIGGLVFINNYINGIRTNYEGQMEELRLELYQNKRTVFVPSHEIKAGTMLSAENLKEVEILSNVPRDYYITQEDLGSIAIIDLVTDLPVYKAMTIFENITDDLREEEFNMILLQSNMTKDKYIDVRITFPNGENYIVLSKKKVRDVALDTNTIWLWLEESEILKFSSAIVDAYIHQGTKLYTVSYVEPGLQKEAIANYIPNNNILSIIATNPNIVEEAKAELMAQVTRDIRLGLDERLSRLKQEELMKVGAGIDSEINKRSDKINQDTIANQGQDLEINDEEEVGGFFD